MTATADKIIDGIRGIQPAIANENSKTFRSAHNFRVRVWNGVIDG